MSLDLATRPEPLAVRIGRLLPAYAGWAYDRANVGVVTKHAAIPAVVRNAPYRATNCSTLTVDLLFALYPDAGWDGKDYGDLQVFADRLPGRPFAPIEAAVRRQVGYEVDFFITGCWHLCQGWHAKPARTGHAFLVYADSQEELLVLEAQNREQVVDTRWTSLGDLRERYRGGIGVAVLRS